MVISKCDFFVLFYSSVGCVFNVFTPAMWPSSITCFCSHAGSTRRIKMAPCARLNSQHTSSLVWMRYHVSDRRSIPFESLLRPCFSDLTQFTPATVIPFPYPHAARGEWKINCANVDKLFFRVFRPLATRPSRRVSHPLTKQTAVCHTTTSRLSYNVIQPRDVLPGGKRGRVRRLQNMLVQPPMATCDGQNIHASRGLPGA